MQVTMSEYDQLKDEARKLRKMAEDLDAIAEAKKNEMPRLTITNQQASSQSTTVILGYSVVIAVLVGVASAAAVVMFLR